MGLGKLRPFLRLRGSAAQPHYLVRVAVDITGVIEASKREPQS